MTNTQAALAFLARFPGAKLFPSRWGVPPKQNKPTHCPLVAWSTKSSNDPDQIKAWAKECDYFCVALEQSDLIVIDTDNKNDKQGDAELMALEIDHDPLPPTLTVQTPSGGRHQFFAGQCAMGANKLAHGIDIPIMVPIPGSTVTGKGSYPIINDAPVPALPQWVVDKAGERREKTAPAEVDVDLDQPHNIIAAVELLKGAPEAIEGFGGDGVALQVAMRVRDLGVSLDTCSDLMHRFYADRCSPYDAEWLQRKVENAYRYASGEAGSKTPEAVFADVIVPDIAIRGSDLDIMATPPREWILGTRLIRKFMSILISPGGGSKSTLTMTEMLAVANNNPLTGDTVHIHGPVWIVNAEDPRDEIQRRLAAICMHFGLNPKKALKNVFISGKEFKPVFARMSKGSIIPIQATVDSMENFIKREGIVVWSLDPFVRAHRLPENDNNGIDLVAEMVSDICDRTSSACTISHHVRKGSDLQGNMDASRGASSLVSAARIVDTLIVMSEKEAKSLLVPDNRRRWYVRLDDAKANMKPPSESARWFERLSVTLPNGMDKVGVLKPIEFETVEVDPIGRQIIDEVFRAMRPGETRGVNDVAGSVREAMGRDAPSQATIRRTIIEAFAAPIERFGMKIEHLKEKRTGFKGSELLVAFPIK